ncbi:hypothetical protein DAMA08_004870 [Martiniozyma asiatica (nom. inval.)]|nr:hypothetical protein DAMA08_004870 [Martiniozyma asiatica]
MSKLRSIFRVIYAAGKEEGIGASVRRSIGIRNMRYFSPFLLLDHFDSPPGSGFPDHPHRGQETITLMMKNFMLHEDFTGSSGILRPGDLQFMTAGKGIMHCEMPYSQDGTNSVGMQLWVDLPLELKHTEPRYRDLRAEEIPIAKPNDLVSVKVISGSSYGVESVKDLAYTPIEYFWFEVLPGGKFEQKVKDGWNSFLYILEGDVEVNNEKTNAHHALFFKTDGDLIKGEVPIDGKAANFVIISGKIIDQPIVQMGPFVETTKEAAFKAYDDYMDKINGFERGNGWKSEFRDGVTTELFQKKADQLMPQVTPLKLKKN